MALYKPEDKPGEKIGMGMGKMGMDMPDESESLPDELAGELGDILGLDEEKAKRLRDVICSLAREEMEGGADEAPEEESAKKPSGIAILLKKGG